MRLVVAVRLRIHELLRTRSTRWQVTSCRCCSPLITARMKGGLVFVGGTIGDQRQAADLVAAVVDTAAVPGIPADASYHWFTHSQVPARRS